MSDTIVVSGYLRDRHLNGRDGFIHIQVAEAKLGRKLGKHERVHHVDGNTLNNAPENLMVFRTVEDHNIAHSLIPHQLFLTSDGSHVAIKVQYVCAGCRRAFLPSKHDDKFCGLACYSVHCVSSLRPTFEDLTVLVWEKPMTEIARLYNVSDVTVSNWCKRLGVEKPPQGYHLRKS